MAQLLRKAGNERLADQHDLIALAMEQRRRSVDEAASVHPTIGQLAPRQPR